MRKLWLVPILVVLAALLGFFISSSDPGTSTPPLVLVDEEDEGETLSTAELVVLQGFWDDMQNKHPDTVLKVYLNDLAGHALVFMPDDTVAVVFYYGMVDGEPYYYPAGYIDYETAEQLYKEFQEESKDYRLELNHKGSSESKKQGI